MSIATRKDRPRRVYLKHNIPSNSFAPADARSTVRLNNINFEGFNEGAHRHPDHRQYDRGTEHQWGVVAVLVESGCFLVWTTVTSLTGD
jgi:hypothetical protein